MAKPTKPKSTTFELGYDSYTADGKPLRFESPPVARAAFEHAIAKARKRKHTVIDATRASPIPKHADRMQLEWAGETVRRAWLTAHETHDKLPDRLASELLALALDHPAFAAVEQIGIGLQQWHDSTRTTFDPIFDVLAAARPKLSALALGDSANEGGLIIRLGKASRIAELYPALAHLRITCTDLPSLEATALPALQTLALRGNWHNAAALVALDRPWPALTSLAVGSRHAALKSKESIDEWSWLASGERTPALRHLAITGSSIHGQLVEAIARGPLLAQLHTLDLRGLSEESQLAATLRKRCNAFAHLEALWLPDTIQIAGLAELGVRVTYREDPARYGSAME